MNDENVLAKNEHSMPEDHNIYDDKEQMERNAGKKIEELIDFQEYLIDRTHELALHKEKANVEIERLQDFNLKLLRDKETLSRKNEVSDKRRYILTSLLSVWTLINCFILFI